MFLQPKWQCVIWPHEAWHVVIRVHCEADAKMGFSEQVSFGQRGTEWEG